MGLLGPWFLVGALAVGLPLWLHLLQRDNPVRLPFSSLMFFEKRKQDTFLQRRFRYLLLLAARLAIFLLVVLAFAKPVWERAATSEVGDIPALHLIVLDTSMSMSYQGRWERALEQARQAIGQVRPQDQGQLLATGPSVSVITRATHDHAELLAALESLEPGPSRNSYGDVVEALRSLAPDADVPVELHLISDFQDSAMPGRFSDLVLPSAASLEIRNVSGADDENWAIESVKGSLRLRGAAKPRLEVTVGAFSAQDARKTVTLEINGQTAGSVSQEVPAMGRASFVFEDFTAPVGFARAILRLTPGDQLEADDLRRVVLDNSDPDPILFVTADRRRRDALYYSSALAASAASAFEVNTSSPGEAERLNPNDYALVVLSDIAQLGTAFEAKLRAYVENGGAVLIAVGPQISARGTTPFTSHRVAPSELDSGGGYLLAGRVEASHEMLSRVESFGGVKFFRHARLVPAEDDDVPAELANGSPLIVEHPIGAGRVLLFASAFDNVWNDLPIRPVFVPFVAESARYLSGTSEENALFAVDSVLELKRGRESGEMVQVFDPEGDRALSLSEAAAQSDVLLGQVGFYELRSPGKTELVAVNSDPRESNLRGMDNDTLELWQGSGRDEAQLAGEPGERAAIKPPPIRIWKLLLFLLAAAVLLESIVGNRHLVVRREV